MLVTKEFTFDMGHRLPNHDGKCRNIHGHTYKLQVTLGGMTKNTMSDEGESDEGMVIDFSHVKKIVKEFIDENLDHYYMSYSGDKKVVKFIEGMGLALTVVDFIPTAENIVWWIYNQLKDKFEALGVVLSNITLWETPTSFASFY